MLTLEDVMLKRFYPAILLDSIYSIDYAALKNDFKIKGLIFDIDNTIAPYDISEPDEQIINFFLKLSEVGFKVCLLSNNNEKRVVLFNKKLNLHAVHRAAKPRLSGINKALALLGTGVSETALIGDQVFTDIWCGNRKGLYTILVKPISIRDEFTVRLKRGFEKIIINSYVRRTKGDDTR